MQTRVSGDCENESKARADSNDLRRKLLEAQEQGQGTLEELADEFGVRLGFAKKIWAALRRTGRMERTEQRHGGRNRVTPLVQEQLREWLRQQPDRTRGELQRQLRVQKQVSLSIPRLWVVLRQMQLRLKKAALRPGAGLPRKPAAPPGLVGDGERDRTGPAGLCRRERSDHREGRGVTGVPRAENASERGYPGGAWEHAPFAGSHEPGRNAGPHDRGLSHRWRRFPSLSGPGAVSGAASRPGGGPG